MKKDSFSPWMIRKLESKIVYSGHQEDLYLHEALRQSKAFIEKDIEEKSAIIDAEEAILKDYEDSYLERLAEEKAYGLCEVDQTQVEEEPETERTEVETVISRKRIEILGEIEEEERTIKMQETPVYSVVAEESQSSNRLRNLGKSTGNNQTHKVLRNWPTNQKLLDIVNRL